MKSAEKTLSRASQGGFTLVELLLVVAILGVLATVAIMNTAGLMGDAQAKATRSSIAAIEEASRVYEIRTGKFPDSIDALTQSMGDRPPLLDDKARNDAWGNPFQVRRNGNAVEIRSAGADGQMNTSDDITN
ncbi:MAG: type II secretion system protein GspG [Kiritimatiellae bacterium]|nr:type II secretion system protein GspG [Kiritimatiellia bacterium]